MTTVSIILGSAVFIIAIGLAAGTWMVYKSKKKQAEQLSEEAEQYLIENEKRNKQ